MLTNKLNIFYNFKTMMNKRIRIYILKMDITPVKHFVIISNYDIVFKVLW